MKTLAKKDLIKAINIWAKKHNVLSPAKTTNGDCIFDTFQEKTFTLDYKKPPLSPKAVFFPHTEVTFKVEKMNTGKSYRQKRCLYLDYAHAT